MSNDNRRLGSFIGLAVGDALGTPLEFKERDTYKHVTDMIGGGPFNLQPGEWTDDTSMAMALGQTIIDSGSGGNTIELLKNFTRWYKQGKFSHNDRCFDIGSTTRYALDNFVRSQGTMPNPASAHFADSGNGGIMRLAPSVIPAPNLEEAERIAVWQSKVTHASPDCVKYARELGRALYQLMQGGEPIEVIPQFDELSDRDRDAVHSTGYVKDTYEASIWALGNTSSFEEAVLLAVNLGDDADTVGAVTGQLAGAWYGYESIPSHWVDKLAWRNQLMAMAQGLISLANK